MNKQVKLLTNTEIEEIIDYFRKTSKEIGVKESKLLLVRLKLGLKLSNVGYRRLCRKLKRVDRQRIKTNEKLNKINNKMNEVLDQLGDIEGSMDFGLRMIRSEEKEENYERTN